MRRLRGFALLTLVLAWPGPLRGQSRASLLIDSARAQLGANHADSAAALLRAALDSASHATPTERKNALVWEAVVRFYHGDESGTRAAFRAALALDTTLAVQGLDRLSPDLADLFRQEKEAAVRQGFVYLQNAVHQQPQRLSGPPVAYPATLLLRHVQGIVEVAGTIDTAGRVEPASLEVLSAPDSALIDPVKQMMLASQFSPGRLKGAPVRTMVQLAVEVRPPRLSATELVTTARAQLAAHRADSALALLAVALDTVITHPTEGERAYALLVRGIAARAAGRDSAARADVAAGLSVYHDLTARGVDLAPFFRRLADSLEGRSRGPRSAMPAPSALGDVDAQPVLVSHPPIRYPPELAALNAEGTVVVEARLDANGRVEAGSPKIVQSANHGFDQEALRVVRGSVYRAARSQGRPAPAVIRQAIVFTAY